MMSWKNRKIFIFKDEDTLAEESSEEIKRFDGLDQIPEEVEVPGEAKEEWRRHQEEEKQLGRGEEKTADPV